MMWRTHIILGVTVPIIVGDFGGAVVGAIGSIAPDWMEQIPRLFGGRKVAHRTTTHILVYWIGVVLVGLSITHLSTMPLWFAVGGLSHVVADMFTPMGVPIFPTQKHRTNILGGAVRTGSMAEYVVMGACLLTITLALRGGGVRDNGYLPFFPDYYHKYDTGVIDAYELKQNRLRFF